MIVYWIVKGVLCLPFFDNLDLSSGIVSAFSTLISYINSFNTIIDFKTFFILLVSFFGILFLALFTKIIVKLITR